MNPSLCEPSSFRQLLLPGYSARLARPSDPAEWLLNLDPDRNLDLDPDLDPDPDLDLDPDPDLDPDIPSHRPRIGFVFRLSFALVRRKSQSTSD